MTTLLELRNIACANEDDRPLFHDVNVLVETGDILILQGKSGCGKTTLLKCIAHLRTHEGDVLYRGMLPNAHGIPYFRTRVMYVPQRPSLLPGTPRDFIETVSKFKAHMSRNSQDGRQPNRSIGSIPSQTSSNGRFHMNIERAMSIADEWEIEAGLWDREWSNLSGGEAQRMALACALGLNTAEVLLLDEPTSALDPESTQLVEKLITEKVAGSNFALKAVIWITHSAAQGHRVGTRFVHLSSSGCQEEQIV